MHDSTVDHDSPPARTSGFPGGRVKLPRLHSNDRSSEPQIDVVGTAFVRSQPSVAHNADEQHGRRSGFTEYFTEESLFDEPPPEEVADADDPYRVLRVRRENDWPSIVAAHRRLVKQFHPDSFIGHPPEVLAQAEAEIRRINLAYSMLRSSHPGGR